MPREAGTALPPGDPCRVRGVPAAARRRRRDPAPRLRVRRGLPQPGQGHPGPARGAGGAATSASPAAMPASAWWSQPAWPPPSPATPWCCPTRRSCGTSRPATSWAPAGSLVFDRTFLRWDRDWATANAPGRPSTARSPPPTCPGSCWAGPRQLAGRSSDWWRQVGAVAARAGQVLGCCLEPPSPDRVRPLPQRGSPGRVRARRPGRPVHGDPRRGGPDRRRGQGRRPAWPAPTSTPRRSRARPAPG